MSHQKDFHKEHDTNTLPKEPGTVSPDLSPQNGKTSPETAETGAPETALDDPAVSALAAALRGLTAEQRAALARALLDDGADG